MSDDQRTPCPVCGTPATQELEHAWAGVHCCNCGRFKITHPTVEALKECPTSSRWRVSSQLSEASRRGGPLVLDLGELVRLMLGE